MSDLPPETTPAPSQPSYPEIDPPSTPDEAPIGTPAPDDGRPVD